MLGFFSGWRLTDLTAFFFDSELGVTISMMLTYSSSVLSVSLELTTSQYWLIDQRESHQTLMVSSFPRRWFY